MVWLIKVDRLVQHGGGNFQQKDQVLWYDLWQTKMTRFCGVICDVAYDFWSYKRICEVDVLFEFVHWIFLILVVMNWILQYEWISTEWHVFVGYKFWMNFAVWHVFVVDLWRCILFVKLQYDLWGSNRICEVVHYLNFWSMNILICAIGMIFNYSKVGLKLKYDLNLCSGNDFNCSMIELVFSNINIF